MATTGLYGPGWWGVSGATLTDIARITADLLVAQALLEARLAVLESADDDLQITYAGTPEP